MGLGLSICQSIIQKHNGFLDITSTVGRGTRVEILLPASSAKNPSSRTEATPVSTERIQGRGRILLMDDEERILKLAALMLQRLGYEVELAEDGEDAVEKYRNATRNNTPFDAVILDLTVRGGMGGEETIRLLKKIDPSVKALVSSGYSNSAVMTAPERYGFGGIVAKPYDLETLAESLYRLLHIET
jgi:CheY-like chemotaxis protein